MITRQFVIDRLYTMHESVLMWAITREGFLCQVSTWLEAMGMPAHKARIVEKVERPTDPSNVTWFQDEVTPEYGRAVVEQAFRLLEVSAEEIQKAKRNAHPGSEARV